MPPRSRPTAGVLRATVCAVVVLVLAACTSTGTSSLEGSGATGSDPARLTVSAAVYPLAYAATAVGGDRVAVTTVAPAHDAELTPADVAGLHSAGLVVYVAGLQPALDAAVAGRAGAFDVSGAANLLRPPDATGQGDGVDLHFWLDPLRLAAVGTAIGERLAQVDPASAADYRAGALALDTQLRELDAEYRTGLAQCARRQLVTGHAAFGYLAERYGFVQLPIAGLSPEQEPTARQLAAAAATVRQTGATTVYTESLADARYAQTVAGGTGTALAVLDPLESLTPASPGSSYPEIMRANLATLRAGQGCR